MINSVFLINKLNNDLLNQAMSISLLEQIFRFSTLSIMINVSKSNNPFLQKIFLIEKEEKLDIKMLLFYHIISQIRSVRWKKNETMERFSISSQFQLRDSLSFLGYRHLRFNYRSIIDFLVSSSVCPRFFSALFVLFDETFILLHFFSVSRVIRHRCRFSRTAF